MEWRTKKKAIEAKYAHKNDVEQDITKTKVRRRSRQVKKESLNKFVYKVDRDVTHAKRFGFKIFKHLINYENDKAKINKHDHRERMDRILS